MSTADSGCELIKTVCTQAFNKVVLFPVPTYWRKVTFAELIQMYTQKVKKVFFSFFSTDFVK